MQTTVLLLVVAVALCGAHHIPIAEVNLRSSCVEGQVERAAHLAVHHINDMHYHGYKFNFTKVINSTVVTVDTNCTITLELSLEETKCHFTNPKHYEDCELRHYKETEVTAECKAVLHFSPSGDSVDSYHCDTKHDKTVEQQCPDFPKMLPLINTGGRIIITKAIEKYNLENTTQHYFVLRDVGRIKTEFVPGIGNFYITEFAMVETLCLTGTRIATKACRPLCPDRARHVFCSATGNLDGITDLDCEMYPAVHHTELAIGEREPLCPYHYEHATLPSNERIHVIEPSAPTHEVHPAPSATAHEVHPAPSATAHVDHPAPSATAHEAHPAPSATAHEDHPAPSATAHEDHPAHSHAAHEDHPAHSHAAHEDHPAHSHAAHEDHPAHSAAGHEVYPIPFICIETVEDPAVHSICDWPPIPLPQ